MINDQNSQFGVTWWDWCWDPRIVCVCVWWRFRGDGCRLRGSRVMSFLRLVASQTNWPIELKNIRFVTSSYHNDATSENDDYTGSCVVSFLQFFLHFCTGCKSGK